MEAKSCPMLVSQVLKRPDRLVHMVVSLEAVLKAQISANQALAGVDATSEAKPSHSPPFPLTCPEINPSSNSSQVLAQLTPLVLSPPHTGIQQGLTVEPCL